MAVLTAGLGSQTLAADKGALLADQRLELAPVPGLQTAIAALVAAFELSLALAVGLELGGGVCCEGRVGDVWCRLDHGDRQQSHARAGVESEEDGANGHEETKTESKSTLTI